MVEKLDSITFELRREYSARSHRGKGRRPLSTCKAYHPRGPADLKRRIVARHPERDASERGRLRLPHHRDMRRRRMHVAKCTLQRVIIKECATAAGFEQHVDSAFAQLRRKRAVASPRRLEFEIRDLSTFGQRLRRLTVITHHASRGIDARGGLGDL